MCIRDRDDGQPIKSVVDATDGLARDDDPLSQQGGGLSSACGLVEDLQAPQQGR